MDVGVFIPIGNNGWLISTTSPQYMPTFDLNREVTQKAERYGFDFALSMIKLRGFGGPSQFWDHNLESFTLMAGLAAVTSRIRLFASVAVLTVPPAFAARMAVTIDSISHGRFGINIVSGWQQAEYTQMGDLARRGAFPAPLRILRRIRRDHARAVGKRPFGFPRRILSDG
jgi:pyrimidine oxygenase